jgi:hypothetical protein
MTSLLDRPGREISAPPAWFGSGLSHMRWWEASPPESPIVNGTRLLSATSYRPGLSAVRRRRRKARTSKGDLMVVKTALESVQRLFRMTPKQPLTCRFPLSG